MAAIVQPHQYSQNSFLSWVTRISRTQISTVNGFSFSEGHKSGGDFTLDGVLRTVQSLSLPRCPAKDLVHLDNLGEGGTFNVAKCRYQEKVVAVKYIKLGENTGNGNFGSLSKRLRAVLQEVCIMHHEPLAKHPTILSILGYGWQQSGGAPFPYLVVEHGEHGSLRSWLRSKPQRGLVWLRWKLTLAGDVAAGLMALHQCGIVHGDLKLDNIIVLEGYLDRPAGVIAKIADFGHSILTSSDDNVESKYFGTALYNAPEVFAQDTSPIKPAQMHKCDIWAYGLLVWEILADGEWYFKYSWRHDPAFARVTDTTLNERGVPLKEATSEPTSSEQVAFFGHEKDEFFGTFDVCHLSNLAKEFVKTSCGHDAQFEKSFLRPFFDQTLRIDPQERPSDLTKLPIMRYWNQSGTARLRSKLAMQLKSSELSFDMFRLESAPEILWSDQKGMLEDIERIANWQQGGARSSVAAYQTGLCYILGFGAPDDLSKAKLYLRKAAETSHPAALLLNDRIFSALGEPLHGESGGYTTLLGQFFRSSGKDLPSRIDNVKLTSQNGAAVMFDIEYAQSLSASDFLTTVPKLLRKYEQSSTPNLRLSINSMQVSLTLPEAAVISGDADLVYRLTKSLQPSAFEILGHNGDPPLIQACKSGRADIVRIMIEGGANPCVRSTDGCTMLHWLFCIEEHLDMIEEALLPWQESLKHVISLFSTKTYTIHQQWPLGLHGTALAFAIMAGSHASVEVLLRLGANPEAKVFDDSAEVRGDWSALHLAVQYHQSSICRAILKEYDPPLVIVSIAGSLPTPFASALAFSSVIERYSIHGHNHLAALDETIACLPPMWFYTMSANGQTPLMQAIEFDDIATVRSLLRIYPELAVTRLSDPDEIEQYTYPILMACQLAARKDHPNTWRIPQIIATYDKQAMERLDSQGRTCLHMAATGISEALIEWLLVRNVPTNSLDHEGRTALLWRICLSS